MTPQPYTGGPADIRMVVTDMDGTLLDSEHTIPESFWPLLDAMRERGVLMVPASGRQYSAIAALFPNHEGMAFLAENGTYVEMDGREIASTTLNRAAVDDVVARVRALGDPDVGVVVCGKSTAYVERSDDAFMAEVSRYYGSLTVIENLDDVDEEILKVALFSFGDIAATVYPHLEGIATDPRVVVTALHWIDIMDPSINKGVAVRALQEELGITRAQTAAFGDYLNDIEALDEAEYSFAMVNAHEDVLSRARYLAPSNDDAGVVTVVSQLLGL